jgi:hypothetical protein
VASDEVFVVREAYDRAAASDGRSRFGVYLGQLSSRFDDEDGPTTDRERFAASAMAIALVPVMSPPYVETHPRVVDAESVQDDEGRRGLLVGFAVPLSAGVADCLPFDVAGWQRNSSDGPYLAPERLDRIAAFGQLTVRIPLPLDLLPAPGYSGTNVADVDTAKRAVRAICNHANAVLARLVSHLGTANAIEHATGTLPGRVWPS